MAPLIGGATVAGATVLGVPVMPLIAGATVAGIIVGGIIIGRSLTVLKDPQKAGYTTGKELKKYLEQTMKYGDLCTGEGAWPNWCLWDQEGWRIWNHCDSGAAD